MHEVVIRLHMWENLVTTGMGRHDMKTTLALLACAASMLFGTSGAAAQSFYARQHLGIVGSGPSATAPLGVWHPDQVLYWDCTNSNGLTVFQYAFACYATATQKVADSQCAGAGPRPAPIPALPAGETCTLYQTRPIR